MLTNCLAECADLTINVSQIERDHRQTGSALALHCCKAHAKINGKIENSTPCKIVTHEDFNSKFSTRDYVPDATHHATLGSNRPSQGFPPNRGNITPVWLFWLYCFFLDPAPSSNRRTDCYAEWLKWRVSAKGRSFLGVWTMGDVIWGKYSLKTPQKRAWIGSFKPKRQILYIAISLELLIRRTSKHNMADGRHLENRYDVIFQRRMFRFGRKSAAGCRMTRRLRRNGQYRNRK